MVVQSVAGSAVLNHEIRSSEQPANIPPQRIPILAGIVAFSLASLTVLIVCVVALAGTGVAPTAVVDPPQYLLPGSPRPVNAICDSLHDGQFRCHVNRDGKEIYLAYDGASHTIVSTVVSAREKTIGDLVLAWGTPIGFTRVGPSIAVHWATRSAHLVTCSFRPASHVGFIVYGPDSKSEAPWRGFTPGAYGCGTET